MSRRVTLVLLAAGALLLVFYALAGFVLLPWLVERHAPAQAAQRLHAELTIGDAAFNPFALRFEAEDVRLVRQPGQPLLVLERVVADLELASLWRRAWTVSELRLEGAQVRMTLGADGRLDWAGLLRERPDAGDDGPAPDFFIEHAVLEDGRLTLADAQSAKQAGASLSEIEIEVFELSSVAGDTGRYSLSAALPEAGTLSAEGSVALQPAPQSKGELELEGLQLATVWPLLRERLGLESPGGTLQLETGYAYSSAGPTPALQLEAAELQLAGAALRPFGREGALLRLQTLAGSGGRFDLAARELAFEEVLMSEGALALNRDARGDFDWQALGAPADEPRPKQQPAAQQPGAAAPWRVRTDALKVEGVALQASDRQRPVPLALDITAIDGSTGLALEFGGGASTVTRLAGLTATLEGPRLAAIGAEAPLLRFDALALSGGALDSADRRIELEEVAARGGQAELVFGADGRLGLLDALAGEADPDPGARSGTGSGPDALPGADADAGSRAAKAASRTAGDGAQAKGWQHRIAAVRAEGVSLALRHEGYEPAIAYRAELAPAALSNVASASEAPMQLALTLRFAGGGTAQAEASIAQGLAGADGRLRLQQVPLLPLQPALAREARLELRSGTLSADTRLELRSQAGQQGTGRALRLSGSASVNGLRIDEADSKNRFLSWRALQAEGLVLDTAPGRLAVRDIELVEPGAKLVIFEDRSVNLMRVLQPERPAVADQAPKGQAPPRRPAEARAAAGPGPAKQTASTLEGPATAPDVAGKPPFQVAVERIRIRKGVLDYADLSLVLPFSTQITTLNGSVLGITTAAGQRARVQAAGEIQPFGSARVNGSLLPFEPTEFLDLRVRMSNVAMPPLSPYTATFAGRKVAEGKLWLELDYHIEDRQLLGENRVRLADFRLGERVEAPDALDLPLDLAVALLTDEQGRIDIAVPVRGNVGDPSFDFGTVVREALGSFLKRIVSAPFRALGKLFGGGGEEQQLPVIDFVPGSDALMPPQREKLHKLGAAIAQRPRLELVVPASYAPERDSRALRRREARRELARLLGDDPAPDERPGLIAYESERTQRALETLLAKVAGEGALGELRAARGATPAEAGGGGRKADPDESSQASAAAVPGGFPTRHLRPGARDAASSDGARDAPPTPSGARPDAGAANAGEEAFYRAVFDRIVARYPIADEAVQLLAARRADAIRDYLVGEAGAPRERVRTGRLESVEGEERLVSTRLQLGASGQEPAAGAGTGSATPSARLP